MDTNKMIGMVVGVMVGVLILSAALFPIIQEDTTETYTKINEGTPFKLLTEAPENPTIVISKVDGDLVIVSDGDTSALPDMTTYGAASIVYGESGYIRLNSAGQIRGFADNFYGVNVTDTVSVTITFNGDNVILTPSEGAAKTVPIKPTAYIGNGSYVQMISPYVNDSSIIYLAGNTNYDGVTHYISYIGYGVTDDLSTATVFSDIGEGVTVEELTHVVNATNTTTNLYKINNIQFTAIDSNEREYQATYSFFIAPAEIVYNNPAYVGTDLEDIFAIIPLLITVGLILGIVGTIFVRRLE